MCIAWKRYCCIQFFYILVISFAVLFFIAIGIILVIAGTYAENGLNDACNGGTGKIADAFNELYSTSDTIYCVASATPGCECATFTHTPSGLGYRAEASYIRSGTTTYNVQDCTTYLESAFASYGIDLSSLNDIISYLDFFGEIEKGYKCSGICNYYSVYYFWDNRKGAPDSACYSNIRDKMIKRLIKGSGIAYIVTGCAVFVIWFIQYGLCCRKKPRDTPGSGESKKF